MQAAQLFLRASYTRCFVVRDEGRKSGIPKSSRTLEVAIRYGNLGTSEVCTSRAVHTSLTQARGCGCARPQSGDGCPIAGPSWRQQLEYYPDCQQESRQSTTPPGQSKTRKCTPSHQDVRRSWRGTRLWATSELWSVVCKSQQKQLGIRDCERLQSLRKFSG
jgi:hypothetical protein